MKYRNFTTLIIILCLCYSPLNGYGANPDHAAAEVSDLHFTRVIDIMFEYNSLGQLTDQSRHIVEDGVGVDGATYHSETTTTFEVMGGKAKPITTTTTSVRDWEDGSHEESTSVITYEYADGGKLVGAHGTRTTSGNEAEYKDDEGNFHPAEEYSGTFEMDFQIISGEAQVVGESGTMTYNTFNEETGEFELNRTEKISSTRSYTMKAGVVKLEQVVSDTHTTFAETDDNGKHLWSKTHVTTDYSYSEGGAVTGASGSGYGSGYILTDAGYMGYTSQITIEFETFNGIARQKSYHEVQHFSPTEAPGDVINTGGDPAVQGTVEDAWLQESAANNVGEKNYYVVALVDADAFDDTEGDGEYKIVTGEDGNKYYLVRIDCGTSKATAEQKLAEWEAKKGTVVTAYGDDLENNVIKYTGDGSGPFDIPIPKDWQ